MVLMAKHPHVVDFKGFINYKDYFILVLEYLSRGDLKCFLQNDEKRKKSENLLGYVVWSVIKALAHLKSKSIIHRDIKPENILISEDYSVKLADFTLAKKIKEETDILPCRSGTLPYLPPESVTKKNEIKYEQIDKLDIFSLGVILYEKLLDKHPFGYKVSL